MNFFNELVRIPEFQDVMARDISRKTLAFLGCVAKAFGSAVTSKFDAWLLERGEEAFAVALERFLFGKGGFGSEAAVGF